MTKHDASPISTRNSTVMLWRIGVCLGIATQLGLLWLYYFPEPKQLVGDEGYYYNLAKALAGSGAIDHHPFWPPLYGEVVGGLFKVFGEARLPVLFFQILLWGLTGWMLRQVTYLQTKQLFLANCVGLLYLAHPELIAFSHYFWPETLHLFWMVFALWVWIRWNNRPAAAVLCGLAIASALLSKLLLLPFLPLCFIAMLAINAKAGRYFLKPLAITTVTLAIFLLPTMHANYQTHGQWMIADSSLFNLWVGFNDHSAADYRDDLAGKAFQDWERSGESWQQKKQVHRQKFAELLKQNGLVNEFLDQFPRQYRRVSDPQTFFLTQLPEGPRQGYRGNRHFGHSLLVVWSYFVHGLVLFLATLGAFFVVWRKPSWWWLIGGFLSYNVALFWLVHVKTRFMVQLFPALFPLAALGCLGLLHFFSSKAIPAATGWQFSKQRLWLGVVGAVGVLVFVFWPR